MAGALLLPRSAAAALSRRLAPPRRLANVDHQIVYRREDEFCSWPHTMGFWDMGDGELLQNFTAITTNYRDADAISHDNVGRGGEAKMVTVRSRDWGRTWDGARPTVNAYERIARGTANAKALTDLGPIDYRERDTLVENNTRGTFASPQARSFVRVSRDRGHTWSPVFDLPLDGLNALAGRESVLVRPDGTVLLFMMTVDKDGFNRHPLVYALPPGGTDFHFLSFITPKGDPRGEADGDWTGTLRFAGHRWFYPRGHMLPNGRMLCVLRAQRDPRGIMWTELYYSDDGGRSWGFLSRVNDFGAPGSLVQLKDGRLVMVYGYRLMPSGIRATVSEDGGASWGPELIVRDDGGSWDVGYPNAWATDDGRVGVLYYFNSKDDPVQVNGGVRHICRSIFPID
ncbi:MAG: exo-alpha-sialidase [Sphingomonadales bacterium]|nr:exo-alpha-sialidase [Sphingomonadales bacterium]